MLISLAILLENSIKIDFNSLVFLVSLMAILIIALIFALLVTCVKKNLQQSEMDLYIKRSNKETFRFAESQRAAVAKNLHDDISMPLNVVKLYLTKISQNNSDKVLLEKLIAESISLLDVSVEHIRNVAKIFTPVPLMKLGYAKGISELCKQINASEHIKIELIIKAGEVRLAYEVELQAYRITQEILNNIIKYSRSTEIEISISSSEEGVHTVICYCGFGLDSKTADGLSETDKGVGLKSIQSRADTIGATVQYTFLGINQYKTTIDVPA